MRIGIALLLFLSLGAVAQPQPIKEHNIFVYGVGTTSCGKFVKDLKQPNGWVNYSSWLNGYLTSVNVYDTHAPQKEGLRDIRQSSDPESLILWMEKYCRANPLLTVMDATMMLAVELGKNAR